MSRTTRRAFLKAGVAGTIGSLLTPEGVLGDPYRDWGGDGGRHLANAAVRIRGVVRSGGRGLPGVAVSDGIQVVDSGPDGTFEMVTTGDGFVWCSVPSGSRIPVTRTGTARFYHPVAAREPEQSVAFDLEPDPRPQEEHTLLLLGDIQTQDLQETTWFLDQTVPDLIETVEGLDGGSSVGIACGDIMYDNLELYPEYETGVSRIGVPFFQVIGNHDLDQEHTTDETSTDTFSRHFGPRYYSFNRGSVHYVVLDDVLWHGSGYIGYLGADALGWLEQDLRRVEAGAPVVVATHIPVLGSQHERIGASSPEPTTALMNREALYRLLEPFQAHLLTGHTHECEHVFEHGTHEHVTGAVCGAWWSGPVCHDGTPNGYCVYDMRGEEVTWRYKATGASEAHQMRIYPPGSDPRAPDELVVNVWNWDPEWTVRWYVNGEPKGLMSRRVGLDPLSAELHTGPELPPRRTWVEPMPTNHLFYAPMVGVTGSVRVEATDRFGRTYGEEWRSP